MLPNPVTETARAFDRQLVERAAGIELRLRQLAAEDPNVFIPYVFRDAKTAAPLVQSRMHRIWHQLIDRYNRLILLGHVNAGKSIQVAQGRVLYELGRNPNLRIGVCCATQKRALRITAAIGEHIENNERLHAVFPHLRMASKVWSPAGFFVRRTTQATDPSVVAIGLHSGILGARLDLLILDDVLDIDNTRTEQARKTTSEWVISMLFGRLDGVDARVILIGNAFHPEDLLHQLEKQPDWAAFRFPVLDAQGRSTWEEKWPMEAIIAKRLEFGELEFARQMMCQARADGEAHFRQSWFDATIARGANIDAPEFLPAVPRDCLSVSSVDLGVKTHAKGSLSSISSSLWRDDKTATLNRITTGKWSAPVIVENVIDHQRRYKSIVVVEDNGSQDFLISQLRQAAPHIIVRTHYTGTNKYHPTYGVLGLAPMFERGDWTFPSKSFNGRPGVSTDVKALIQDMLYYNPTNHLPDRLSSFWIGNHYAMKKLLRQAGEIEFDPFAR